MKRTRKGKVLVVGAGLGGLSAALSLAAEGYQVEVFEKNERIGGKLNLLEKQGYRFDLGPSIIILPHLFRRLFERAGRNPDDYVQMVRLEPQWRCFWEDGVQVDLFSDVARMESELDRLGAGAQGYWEFVDYSRRLWKFCEEAYLERGAENPLEILRAYSSWDVLEGTDSLHTVWQGVTKRVREPHLRDLLGFFIKYVGSSCFDAPATLNLLPYSQLTEGLWYVTGGLYNLARGLGRLAEELGIKVHLGEEVTRIQTQGKRVSGLLTSLGAEVQGDIVVCNMEVMPAYERLLGEPEDSLLLRRYRVLFEPAASGLVLHLGLNRTYPQVQHHNFFFARDLKKHLDSIHRRKELPEDPTLYVVSPTVTDSSLAPPGKSILKILPHIPYVQNPGFSNLDYQALRNRVLDKLERLGLEGLRQHIEVEDMLVPEDLERLYYSHHGAIYGTVCNRRNLGFKAPRHSERFENLWFVGGSVNPGGGTPMVVLSGQLVARSIINQGFLS